MYKSVLQYDIYNDCFKPKLTTILLSPTAFIKHSIYSYFGRYFFYHFSVLLSLPGDELVFCFPSLY